MGMVDRGADISWLSQFAHEKARAALLSHMPASQATPPTPLPHASLRLAQEILFPPLMALEVLSSGVENRLMVVDARLSLNMMSQTLEQARVLMPVPNAPPLLVDIQTADTSHHTLVNRAQVIAKMKTSLLGMIEGMCSDLKHMGV